jgi:hypothetical protein
VIRGLSLAAAAALVLPLAACGKKGPPLAPLRPIPGQVTELAGRRVGQQMEIRFTLPTQNISGTERISLESADIYAVTVAPGGVIPPAKELLTREYLVASIEVREPPEPEEAEAPEKSETPQKAEPPPATGKTAKVDERPLPGEPVTFVEALTDAVLKPAILPKPPVAGKGVVPPVPAALDPAVVTRYYVVRGRSRSGHPGAQSARLALPLVSDPEPPADVKADWTEKALTLSWTAPPAIVDPVAAAAHAHAWAAVSAPPQPIAAPVRPRETPVVPAFDPFVPLALTRLPGVQLPPTVVLATAPGFNVYAVTDGTVADRPLNSSPLTVATYPAGEPVWNAEVCFLVRTVRAYGLVTIESTNVEPTCVTPADTFPPAAPSGLRAVAAAGAMNLIWDPNTEPDVAGYVVLRGEAPGATLQALTPAPIAETSYTDTTVTPGVRYVYAVVAVDKAATPNMSAQSARVEEVAR